MSRMTITLEIDSPAEEQLLRHYHALIQEINDLADRAPQGQLVDVLEGAILQRGREALRATLEQAVQRRIDGVEKKGRRCGSVPVDGCGRTAGRHGGNW
jgi:hypothetical protein